ncbi:MAG: Yip1 family protein [Rhodocyclaceae bacterium]
MSLMSLSRMVWSEREGWLELQRDHPSVAKLWLAFVLPMSLIPPAMFVFSALVYPGAVFPQLEPQMSLREALIVGGAFFLAELAMVQLMALVITQVTELSGESTTFQQAFTLAAVAPTPLWAAALVLILPSAWLVVLMMVVAWGASVALIWHGVGPLLGIGDHAKSRLMASFITTTGVMAWIGLIIVLVMLLSMIMGFR